MLDLFKKVYSGESLVDLEQDVSEAISSQYNELASEIPRNEHGMQEGTFTVMIVWEPDSA